MLPPRIEVPTGAVDGTNLVFVSSLPYTAGQLSVFLNGVLQRRDFDDGWVETDPAAGVVTLKEAPRTGDTVQLYYLPNTGEDPSTVSEVVCELVGTIETVVSYTARLQSERRRTAVISRCVCQH